MPGASDRLSRYQPQPRLRLAFAGVLRGRDGDAGPLPNAHGPREAFPTLRRIRLRAVLALDLTPISVATNRHIKIRAMYTYYNRAVDHYLAEVVTSRGFSLYNIRWWRG
jgi:hypothetical protein